MSSDCYSLKEEFRGLGQSLGKAILLPIAILPVAGLFLGISAALSSKAVKIAYPILQNVALQNILSILNAVGDGVFTALPIIFAIGISVGLAKNEKGTAALAGVVGYFVLLTSVSALLTISGKMAPIDVDMRLLGQANQFGIKTLNMNVFGGILAGIVTGFVHNRFYKTRLPDYLAFFGGSRFVPIINTFIFVIVGLVMFFVWPSIASVIAYIGKLTQGLGIFGAFLYGLILRSFYIIGLHHVFYLPFWTTAAGGTLEVSGKTIEGWQQIFLAQLADPNTIKYFSNIALYNSGRYIHMIFGLPAVCAAMYYAIPKGPKRKATFGFLLSIALTCLITGVTEPISFALLFASPILFAGEAFMFACSFVVAALLYITIGSTFSAGIIEFLLFGVFQGNAKTNYIALLIAGVLMAFVYYFVFIFLINKLKAKTPGLDEDTEIESEMNLDVKVTCNPAIILNALGGIDNITELDNCATRLRVTVKKIDNVNVNDLKKTGAPNSIVRGKYIQVIYGPKVNLIRQEIDEYLQVIGRQI